MKNKRMNLSCPNALIGHLLNQLNNGFPLKTCGNDKFGLRLHKDMIVNHNTKLFLSIA